MAEGTDAGFGALFTALGFLQWCLLIAVVIWIGAFAFESIVRRRHNLTRAETEAPNRKLELDYLKKDHEARQRALEAGDAYERELDAQDTPPREGNMSRFRRLFAVASAIMAVVTLIGVISGTIIRFQHTETVVREAGLNRLTSVIDQYPVGTYLSVFVVAYHAIAFFVFEKWKGDNL